MFIQTEDTPNPNTLKFIPGVEVLSEGTVEFINRKSAKDSHLANLIFLIEGVSRVFFSTEFISVTKNDESNWDVLKPMILSSIMDHFATGKKNIEPKKIKEEVTNEHDSEIVKQIKELLDTRVRPAVAMDGGDIIYDSFKDGIVYLHMQGACSGCPSSTATLKMGIENMLKHYVPEVQEVRPIDG